MQTQGCRHVSFDVKAYIGKDAPKVTLMEGKVKVSNADTEVEMRPGNTATLQADKIVVLKASSFSLQLAGRRFRSGSGYAGRGDERRHPAAWYNKTVVFQSQANMNKLIHFRFSRRASLAENHHGAERDGCGKSQNRKGQDHGALSHGLAPFPIPSKSKRGVTALSEPLSLC